MHSLNKRARWCVSLGLCLLSVLVEPAAAQDVSDQYLRDLKCVDIKAHILTNTKARDPNATAPPMAVVSEQELDDSLLVALKSKLPRLSVSAACQNRLVLNVQLYDLSTGSVQVFFGVADLVLYRQAAILETGQSGKVAVWASSGRFWGSPSDAKTQALKSLESLMIIFSASYYRVTGSQ